jgi:hypothetical protein
MDRVFDEVSNRMKVSKEYAFLYSRIDAAINSMKVIAPAEAVNDLVDLLQEETTLTQILTYQVGLEDGRKLTRFALS